MRAVIRVVAVALAAAAAGSGQMAAAAGRAPLAGTWHVAFTVKGSGFPEFSAVAATGKARAWAFESFLGTPAASPVAYQLAGSTWRKHPFPGVKGDVVTSASASSAANVWAFLSGASSGRALRYDGKSWSLARKFTKAVGSGLAISSTSVWVFGTSVIPGSGLGAWHYNGRTWTRPATGAGLLGASALSATSVWAFGERKVAHWNGRAWASTSVAGLLPKRSGICGPGFLTGIYAASRRSVFAVGSGGCPDGEGPLLLLHYNGAHWSRVSLPKVYATPEAIAPDGTGGLWICEAGGAPASGYLGHYSGGKLTRAHLPIGPQHLLLMAITRVPGSTSAFAAGFSRTSFNATTTSAVILGFGP